MLKAQRHAEMIWHSTLARGNGRVTVGSSVVEALPMTWASRIERPDGQTSPEELLAAAHAGCYAMALALTLAEGGTPPERLRVTAVCTLEEVDQKPKITRMDLEVFGRVAGLDATGFARAAQQAEQLCPVSGALRTNVAMCLTAHLED